MTAAKPQPTAAAVPRLTAALHTRIEPPFASGCADWHDRAALAGELAGRRLAAAVAAAREPPEAAFVLSTLLGPSFTANDAAVRRFTAAFEAASGLRLHGLVNAYLCAGWGFLLRHVLRHTRLRRVALCIVDLDLFDLAWQREHPVIGRSGFGVSALLFDLPGTGGTLPDCAGPFANSAFTELLLAVRAQRVRHGDLPTFLPFTQPALRGIAERLLGAQTLSADRYATWGHCFGSDPWIGVIEWLAGRPAVDGGALRVLAGAIAFNGYYAVSAIDIEPGLPAAFDVRRGDRLAQPDGDAFLQPSERGPVASAVPTEAVLT
jgi:hypothetical protein